MLEGDRYLREQTVQNTTSQSEFTPSASFEFKSDPYERATPRTKEIRSHIPIN